MLKKIIIFSLVSLFFSTAGQAEEKINFEDRIISLTLKTLARAFVAMEDFSQLKESNIRVLENMEEARFRKEFAKTYAVLKDLPPEIKGEYHLWEDMSKEEVIQELASLDKKRVYRIIDDLPDVVVAREFRRYLFRHSRQLQGHNILEQISLFWSRVLRSRKNIFISLR
jgi:uncharacterized protein YbaR (Trm112 family)